MLSGAPIKSFLFTSHTLDILGHILANSKAIVGDARRSGSNP
jgi:hypothetical protein